MDVKKYEVFVSAVDCGSLTKAAEAMGLTQSGVSHIIAAVEAELQLPLLKRTRTGARLTPEGERVIGYLREIVRQEKRMFKEAERLNELAAGTIRIGTFTSVATHWLPAMMMEFQKEYPQIDFQLFNGDYHDVDRWVTDGSVDIAFITLPTELKCRVIPLYEDALAAVLPKGHPLAAQPVCRVEDVAKEAFISLLEASNHDARRALDAVNMKPNVRFRTKDDYAVIAMVRQGLGVSIMPSLLLRGNSENIEIRPIDPPVSRTIALAVAGDDPAPAPRKFAEFAENWVRENGK
ncbi:MAG: LysR family transcriptional regulator [Candidatus Faecivicinus sp.]|nr:LysR family transcriptional regulator [Candidatus Faecivicinus sp.]